MAIDVREIREGLGMTQAAFAETFGIPIGTLRHWERGARQPDSASLHYLAAIRHEPEAVRRAIGKASDDLAAPVAPTQPRPRGRPRETAE